MKAILKIHAVAGAVALMLASGAGVAEQMMGGSSGSHMMETPSFSELDANNDGQISQDEAAGSHALQQHWQSVDKNSDQNIDRSEFSAFEGHKMEYKTQE